VQSGKLLAGHDSVLVIEALPMIEAERGVYEGLNGEATQLWVKFLKLYQTEFQTFTYNVRLGKGLDPGPSASDTTRVQWQALTSKRADVVAERPGQTWLIEVEPRITARTVGQIVTYRHLIPQYWPVRESLISDMGHVLRKQNVLWFKFPVAGEPSLPGVFPPPVQVSA
jgi:hypothetical protein